MVNDILEPLKSIYSAVEQLSKLYPGRRFTPDGHMVGSIGEVLAELNYEIVLLPTNTPKHDARTRDGKFVQIRTTQGNSIPLKEKYDNLLVLKLLPNAEIEEYYNGPGLYAWELTRNRKPDKYGQYNISLSKFKVAMSKVKIFERIQRKS